MADRKCASTLRGDEPGEATLVLVEPPDHALFI
jgi:hypothetical protein